MSDRIVTVRLPGLRYERIGNVAVMTVLWMLKVRWIGPHLSVRLS